MKTAIARAPQAWADPLSFHSARAGGGNGKVPDVIYCAIDLPDEGDGQGDKQREQTSSAERFWGEEVLKLSPGGGSGTAVLQKRSKHLKHTVRRTNRTRLKVSVKFQLEARSRI